jgi:D-sedoheptulose 7-phosphate isomerase
MELDIDQHVIELFHSSIDTSMQSLETLAPTISDCGTLLVQCLLSDNKIICCGESQSGALAQIFASNLLNRFESERPGLPAIALNDFVTMTAIASDSSFNKVFSKQIRALGQSGDILLILSNESGSNSTIKAIQAAHDREMIVVSISYQNNGDISALMLPEDIEINIPSSAPPRINEAQLFVINCLCDLIDKQLFGSDF